MKKISLVLFFTLSLIALAAHSLSLPLSTSAQTTGGGQSRYYLYGTVFGDNFNTPLFGADVALVNKKTNAVERQSTNSAGGFAFYVPAGSYSLNVIARGYQVASQGNILLTSTPINTYFILKKLGSSTSNQIGDGTENPGANITGSPTTSTGDTSTTGSTNTTSGSSTGSTGKAVVNADGTITSWSNCVVTIIGNPKTTPILPANCDIATETPNPTGTAPSNGGSGSVGDSGGPEQGAKWRFPLEFVSSVHGIATEMAAYAGDFQWGGHSEHAGLDMGIPGGPGSRVYAITDGTIIERTDGYCPNISAGCSVQIRHSTDKYQSRYTHIDIAEGIYDGQFVKKGTILGTIHAWNNDHLHFELRNQERLDSTGSPVSVNPRNYYPALNQFPISEGYYGNVRAHTQNRGYPWQNDGRLFGEMYLNHPPCVNSPGDCWAH